MYKNSLFYYIRHVFITYVNQLNRWSDYVWYSKIYDSIKYFLEYHHTRSVSVKTDFKIWGGMEREFRNCGWGAKFGLFIFDLVLCKFFGVKPAFYCFLVI